MASFGFGRSFAKKAAFRAALQIALRTLDLVGVGVSDNYARGSRATVPTFLLFENVTG
jgi:hypothetical protein